MEKLRLTIERCKGCGLCVSVCPKSALSLSSHLNGKGYNHVQVDAEKCIQCGMCYTTCPDYVIEVLDKEA